jgi:FkbM family methyltransferase
MTMVSYAQNREDVVLARAFLPEHVGFYVDVGASDPVVDSVTKHFYDRGWRGVNVEPATIGLKALTAARPDDVNLGVGLGASPGEATFYELPLQMTGCSTFSDEIADQYRGDGWDTTTRTVAISTLAALCEEHVGELTIDFLKLDVEGDEAEVLAGADFEHFRPRILVIEATMPGTSIPSHERWEPRVLSAGYRLTLFDGLNRFYVREEDADLAPVLSIPANVLDDYIAYPCLVWREEAAAARSETRDVRDRAAFELAATRKELAHSQALLRDARAELTATREALLGAVADRPTSGAAA